MTTQLTFDAYAARSKRDAAIENVADSQHGLWLIRAVEAVHTVARFQRSLTVDDVWKQLHGMDTLSPTNGSAMGPVMLRAKAKGYVEATGLYRTSSRVATNARRLPVWKSLVYEGEADGL